MRRIIHISDVHFGQVDYSIVDRAVDAINTLDPHLVVVSGDLTQRARTHQFIEARDFLRKLPEPQIVVPGNHDVPLYNIFDRFVRPLEKFKKFITHDLTPTYVDDELAVIGVNTARSLVIKGGRINQEQIGRILDQMCEVPDRMLKIVVTHHPFDLPEVKSARDIVGRAQMAMPMMADCGADLFLAGHLHVSNVVSTAKRYKLENGKAALVVQAGTATSSRGRGEAHSFNVLDYQYPELVIKRFECLRPETGFSVAESKTYFQSEAGWVRVEP
jgi:3',5'-cyclic AMP phosphodiesterase CpdA